ncbi:hypothetical protein PAMA_001834 [Pampus argenteus]
MSTKKLLFFGFFIFVFQVLSILVGALIAPSPTSAIRYLATKCINRHRTCVWLVPWGSNRCQQIHSFDEPLAKTLDANDIVFAVHVPLPNTEMSPWFQYLLAVLQFDIAFKMINQIEDDAIVTIDASLAYRDDLVSEWTTEFHSVEQRPLRCTFEAPKGIHQNGGFTKVWISMKTVFSPWMFGATAWYWHRICLTERPPVLLEKVIFALGVSMTFLNVPVEWFSMGSEWTWMLLFEDVQQGVFYSALFCFWIIFCGEHLMDRSQRNKLSAYWWQVGLVVFGSSVLLIFDLSERFKFLMLVTLACAAMTVIFFILTQVSEGQWRWGDYNLQIHSGVLTGVYGMWNLYVFAIIFLCAPSHKDDRNTPGDGRQTGNLPTDGAVVFSKQQRNMSPSPAGSSRAAASSSESCTRIDKRLNCDKKKKKKKKKKNSVGSETESRFEHSCLQTAMSSKMQSIAQARRTVQQLRIEASIDRIKVSKASSDLMRYCGEHAKNDPLLIGVPASENPFKDKKPCTVL